MTQQEGSVAELEDQSPASWQFLAEGEHNVVVSYTGPLPSLKGTVLRIAKCKKGREPEPSPLAQLAFARRLVAPCIGANQLATGSARRVSRAFLESVEPLAAPFRRRKHSGGEVDRDARLALLMPDLTLVPGAAHTVSAEIKPKWGFLQPGRRACRFCMQQLYKIETGAEATRSGYCPLDLFSGDRTRVCRALRALAECPQNNLRLCVDGRCVLPAPEGRVGCPSPAGWSARCSLAEGGAEELRRALPNSRDDPLSEALGLVASALLRSTALQAIRSAQLLDAWGAEGIAGAWSELAAGHAQELAELGASDGDAWSQLGDDDVRAVLGEGSWKQPLPGGKFAAGSEEARSVLNKVRSFLLSATLKDCSVFVAVPVPSSAPGAAERVTVADVDMRQPSQVARYLSMERAITENFVRSGDSRVCCP